MQGSRFTLLLSLCLLFLTSNSPSQTASRPKKVLTPEQQRFQDQLAKWRTDREELRVKANAALKVALEGASTDRCRNAGSNLDLRICLDKQLQTLQEQYAAFTSSLHAMLALPEPESSGAPRAPGPSGMPLTSAELATEFDRLEAQWKDYRDTAAQAAFHQWGGGSGAPAAGLSTQVRLLRSHMQELASIYDTELSAR